MPLVMTPFGTIDDTGRVELSSEVVKNFIHTENLSKQKLKIARKIGDLEAETDKNPQELDIGRVVELNCNFPSEFSSSIKLTDSYFILTYRTCAIAITADMSF